MGLEGILGLEGIPGLEGILGLEGVLGVEGHKGIRDPDPKEDVQDFDYLAAIELDYCTDFGNPPKLRRQKLT